MSEAVEMLTPKDYASDQEVRWCPGCGDYSILKAVHRALADAQADKEAYLGRVGPAGSRARQTSVSVLLQQSDQDIMETRGAVHLLRQQVATARSLMEAGESESAYFTELGNENTVEEIDEAVGVGAAVVELVGVAHIAQRFRDKLALYLRKPAAIVALRFARFPVKALEVLRHGG